MNRTNKHALSILACGALNLTAIASSPCSNCLTIKHFTRRSDSRQKPLLLVGDYHHTYRRDTELWYGLLSVTPTYRASFRYEEIADALLGSDRCQQQCGACTSIAIQGSAIEKRTPRAWLADHFYLPRNYDSSFTLKPTIKNISAMFDLFLGSPSGLYARLFGPVVHSRWNLRFQEYSMGSCCKPMGIRYDEEGNSLAMNHSCGYFSQAEYEGTKLVRSFKDYMCGAIPQPSEDENNNITFNPLKYAKMTCGAKQTTALADLRAEFGYSFLNHRDYRLALNIQGAAPTGKLKKPCLLFDAMVGNGNHWELGGGLNGHYRLWESLDNDLALDFVFDANVTHMFKKRQCRTFDLKGRADSAYMLAAKFGPNDEVNVPNNPLQSGDALVDAQIGWRDTRSNVPVDPTADPVVSLPSPNRRFALEYAPVANLSTVNVDVSIAAHVDIVGMLHYTCGNMYWDLGYNFWARSCEKIDCPKPACNNDTLCDPKNRETWALKGDARMFGFQNVYQQGEVTPVRPNAVTAIPLSATQSNATIYSGTNQVLPSKLVENNATTLDNASGYDVNLHVDAPQYAFTNTPLDADSNAGPLSFSCDIDRYENATQPADVAAYLTLTEATDNIKTSSNPVFLSCSDIALTRARGISHTVFSHLSYGCTGDRWDPYIGIGTSIEFGNTTDTCCSQLNCCVNCCDTGCSQNADNSCNNACLDIAVSQWSVWLKAGMAFAADSSSSCTIARRNGPTLRKKKYTCHVKRKKGQRAYKMVRRR